MKKLSIRITFVIALVLGGCGGMQAKPPTWAKYETKGVEERYVYGSCAVVLITKGNMLQLNAYNNDGLSRSIVQTVSFQKTASGDFKKNEYYETRSWNSHKYSKITTYTGPDLFASKCAEAAKELPESIQEFFHGFYGIGGVKIAKNDEM